MTPAAPPRIDAQWLGRVDYDDGLRLQHEARLRVAAGQSDAELLALEHPPVFTLGRHAKPGNLLMDERWLGARGVQVRQVDRGGDVTFHGPGQLVVYPIVALPRLRLTVKALVFAIERSLVDYLAELGLEAVARPEAPGVYVGGAKLGFLGLRIEDHISRHGLALNVSGSLEPFTWMNPCGAAAQPITSVAALRGQAPALETVARQVCALLTFELSRSV